MPEGLEGRGTYDRVPDGDEAITGAVPTATEPPWTVAVTRIPPSPALSLASSGSLRVALGMPATT